LSDVSSLGKRRIESVIVVPLAADRKPIGAIYLDSASPANRLSRDHLDFVAVVAESAGPAIECAQRLKTLKERNRRLESTLHLKHNLIGLQRCDATGLRAYCKDRAQRRDSADRRRDRYWQRARGARDPSK
jgi:GAF domain-containing protein